MPLLIIAAIVVVIAVAIAVIFGPHRSLDVLKFFGFAIKFVVLLPFLLVSALFDALRRKDTHSLDTLVVTAIGTIFSVPYLVLRFLGFLKEDDETSDSEAEEGQFAAIGEPVVLQTSWKEPPFAITVLGPPERIDGERDRVRVPVRYTGILHRWSHFSVGGYPAILYTSENADGERVAWESEYVSEWGPSFEEFVLIEGGTHDRYLYFRAGEDEERKTVPRRRFVELTWLDGSETTIKVDLKKSVMPVERIRFRDGVAEHQLDRGAFDDRLRKLGSQWADLGDAPAAGIGDVVKVRLAHDSERWDVTALGLPERLAEDMVRLPLRLTSRSKETRPFSEDALQIGTTPDESGVIQHLWTPRDFAQEGSPPEDCLHGVELQRSESREGAVYFSPSAPGQGKELPTEPFTTLWYGINYMEMPLTLTKPEGQFDQLQ